MTIKAMTFNIKIELDKDAFGDTPAEAADEVLRILRKLGPDVYDPIRWGTVFNLMDSNWNEVGKV